eukprot:13242110-Ditylum_brightwellii.AAC.1
MLLLNLCYHHPVHTAYPVPVYIMPSLAGQQLKEEAAVQVKYCEYMLSLSERLPHKSYDSNGEGSVPGLPVLFKEAATLY